jgi:hypothetical protein
MSSSDVDDDGCMSINFSTIVLQSSDDEDLPLSRYLSSSCVYVRVRACVLNLQGSVIKSVCW